MDYNFYNKNLVKQKIILPAKLPLGALHHPGASDSPNLGTEDSQNLSKLVNLS